MIDRSSILYDMVLQSGFFDRYMNVKPFEESEYAKNYKLFLTKLNKELKDLLKKVEFDLINYLDEKEYIVASTTLNIGIKIGMDYKEIMYEID